MTRDVISGSTSRSRDGLETYPRARLGLDLGLGLEGLVHIPAYGALVELRLRPGSWSVFAVIVSIVAIGALVARSLNVPYRDGRSPTDRFCYVFRVVALPTERHHSIFQSATRRINQTIVYIYVY
jgi:hypothetical protein